MRVADHVIEISETLLHEHDGPVLELALREFDGRGIHVPRSRVLRPREDHLAERFEVFRGVG